MEVQIHFTFLAKKSIGFFFEHVESERKEKTGPDAQATTEDSAPGSGVRNSFQKGAVWGMC